MSRRAALFRSTALIGEDVLLSAVEGGVRGEGEVRGFKRDLKKMKKIYTLQALQIC